jgi:predicted RNA methylase
MKISDDVLAVLGNCTFVGLNLYLPEVQLDRKLYEAVNKVLVANGGKWNRSARAHVFDEPAEEAIEQALLTGEFRRVKQDLGQFDTPSWLAEYVVDLARIEPGMTVYEPSCGIGNIVAEAIKALGSGAGMFANEIDPKRHAACVTRHYNAFGAGGLGLGDFLLVPPPTPGFDRVVMNPPFAKQADIDHVTHALKFVKPGGRLVSIMSSSLAFRQNRKALDFKRLIGGLGDVHMEPVPEAAFKESGTLVGTIILAVQL